MKLTKIFVLCMIVATISFLGFVIENIWLAATKGFMDNRNMCFPFLIGYGLAIMFIFIIWGTPKRLWLFGKAIRIQNRMIRVLIYFVNVVVCICVGEIILGTLVEKLCHFSWWDYSWLPLHITKYTSILTSMAFALLITFIMNCFFEPLCHFFANWDYRVLSVAATSMMVIMTSDFAYNAYKMYKIRGMIVRWRIDTTGSRLYKRIHA